jgi:hypothetical protein
MDEKEELTIKKLSSRLEFHETRWRTDCTKYEDKIIQLQQELDKSKVLIDDMLNKKETESNSEEDESDCDSKSESESEADESSDCDSKSEDRKNTSNKNIINSPCLPFHSNESHIFNFNFNGRCDYINIQKQQVNH